MEVDRCTLWELERLKARWRVSIKAQIVRLSRLDIINEDTATRLYKIYSAKGYAKAEPYDAAWPLQRPTLLADVFRTIIDEGQLSKAELRHDLPLLPHDVERLASLPEGWLTRRDHPRSRGSDDLGNSAWNRRALVEIADSADPVITVRHN